MEILEFLKYVLFDKHNYDIGMEKYIIIKNMAHFYSIKNVHFSMYYNNDFKDMIYELKYKRKKYIAKSIFNIIKDYIDYIVMKNKIDYIICVPISKKREKERGFNQVEEIFKYFKYEFLKIHKIKETKKMSKLKTTYQKNLNILNTFDVKKLNLNDKSILIVDDIITSGATIKEIEKNIKNEYRNVTIYFYAVAISKKYINKIKEKNN